MSVMAVTPDATFPTENSTEILPEEDETTTVEEPVTEESAVESESEVEETSEEEALSEEVATEEESTIATIVPSRLRNPSSVIAIYDKDNILIKDYATFADFSKTYIADLKGRSGDIEIRFNTESDEAILFTSNISLPATVGTVTIVGSSSTVINLNGKVLTAPHDLVIKDNAYIESKIATAGRIVSTAGDIEVGESNTADIEISNVSVEAAKGKISLQALPTESDIRNLVAESCDVASGDWQVTTATINGSTTKDITSSIASGASLLIGKTLTVKNSEFAIPSGAELDGCTGSVFTFSAANLSVNGEINSARLIMNGTVSERDKYTFDNVGNVVLSELNMAVGTFNNAGTAAITNVSKINNFINSGTFDVTKYAQNTGGKTTLTDGSVINSAAELATDKITLCNIIVEGTPKIEVSHKYANETAKTSHIAINGSITTESESDKLHFVGAEALTFDNGDVVATSNMADGGALSEVVEAEVIDDKGTADTGDDTLHFEKVFYNYNSKTKTGAVTVGSRKIEVLVKNTDDESETSLDTFSSWTDASTYITAINNSAREYIVEINADVDANGALAMPKTAKSITFRGKTDNESITYTGNLTLTTQTYFENLSYIGANTAAKSTLVLSGKDISFENVGTAEFLNITGSTSIAKFSMTDSDVALTRDDTKATSVIAGTLEMSGSSLSCNHNFTSNGTLDMQTSYINVYSNTVLNNIVSRNSKIAGAFSRPSGTEQFNQSVANIISVAGNTKGAQLVINGTITGENSDDSAAYSNQPYYYDSTALRYYFAKEAEEDVRGNVRSNALIVVNKYFDNEVPIFSTKASKVDPTWIVGMSITSDDSEILSEDKYSIYPLTKDGDQLKYKDINAKAVTLQSVNGGNTVRIGDFDTLAEAFAEINRLNNIQAEYKIVLDKYIVDTKQTEYAEAIAINPKDMSVVNVTSNADLAWPTKAAKITVAGSGADTRINIKSTIKLGCNTDLVNIRFYPTAVPTLNVQGYTCNLENTDFDTYSYNIVGSGVNKTSNVVVRNSANQTIKAVSGVYSIDFEIPNCTIEGAVTANRMQISEAGAFLVKGNVTATDVVLATAGDVKLFGAKNVITNIVTDPAKQATLTTKATVTYATKGNYIGKISKVVPCTTVNGEIGAAGILYMQLADQTEKIVGTGDIAFEQLDFIPFINAKSAKAVTQKIQLAGVSRENACSVAKRNGQIGYLENVAFELSYLDGDTEILIGSFGNWTDVVTEINNQRIKRAYVVSAVADVRNTATDLTMPNAAYCASLTIDGARGAAVVDPLDKDYLGNLQIEYKNAIATLPCDVVLRDVSFKRTNIASTAGLDAVTLNANKHTLTIEGKVGFNTPIVLNGAGGASVLNIRGMMAANDLGHELYELRAGQSIRADGSIISFGTVDMTDASYNTIELHDFANSKGANVASSFTATTVCAVGGSINTVSPTYVATTTITNAYLTDTDVVSNGKLNITNLYASGSSVVLSADKDFNITTTFVNEARNMHLHTRMKADAKNALPYLTINAAMTQKVNNEVKVSIKYPIGAREDESYVLGEDGVATNGAAYTHTLTALTAKTADANFFSVDADSLMSPNTDKISISDFDPDGNGYFTYKQGTAVNIAYASDAFVAVTKDDGEVTDFAATEPTWREVGYYKSFNAATTAIDALNDVNATYTMTLLQDCNVNNARLEALVLPKKAAKVYVNSITGSANRKELNTSKNIVLNTDTVFDGIKFAPKTAKNVGMTATISTSGKTFEIKNCVSAADVDIKSIINIAGAKNTGVLVLASEGYVIGGTVSAIGTVRVDKNATINGNVTAIGIENANNDSGVVLTTAGTVTCTNINESENNVYPLTIEYAHNYNAKTKADTPRLAINGDIGPKVNLVSIIPEGKQAADYKLVKAANSKVDIANKSLFTLKGKWNVDTKVSVGATLYATTDEHLVRAGNGVYCVDESALNSVVVLSEVSNAYPQTNYLDLAQATTAITAIKNPAAAYTLELGGGEVDPNATDGKPISPLSLPNASKAALYKTLTIDGMGSELPIAGGMTVYGDVSIIDVCVEEGSARTNMAVNLLADKTGISQVVFDECDFEPMTGYSVNLAGTKGKTKLIIDGTTGANGKQNFGTISNIVDFTFMDVGLTTTGNATITGSVSMQGTSTWDAQGTTSVGNIVDFPQNTSSYIMTRYAKKNVLPENNTPTFTVTGMIEEPIVIKLEVPEYNGKTFVGYCDPLDMGSNYLDKKLILAKAAGADNMVIAAPYAIAPVGENLRTLTKEEYKSKYSVATGLDIKGYKDATGYIYNGDLSQMQVEVRSSNGLSYAKTLSDAVKMIDAINDVNAEYTITLRMDSESNVPDDIVGKKVFYFDASTEKNGTAKPVALTLPTKAASVRINSTADESKRAMIVYTGKLNIKTNTEFDGIDLGECTYNAKTYVRTINEVITPVLTAGRTLTFDDAYSYKATGEDAGAYINAVNNAKANIVVDGVNLYAKGDVTLAKLTTNSNIYSSSKITVTDLAANGNVEVGRLPDTAPTIAPKAVTFTNITGNANVIWNTYTNNQIPTSPKAATNATLNGVIGDSVMLNLMPHYYDSTYKTYENTFDLSGELGNINNLIVTAEDIAKPAANKKFLNMPKANADNVQILIGGGEVVSAYTYKYEKGLYLTNERPTISLTSTVNASNQPYSSMFITWDQVVKEINNRADSTAEYIITLSEDVGSLVAPIAMTMPSKAAKVTVCSGATPCYIYTTTKSIPISCKVMEFNNVGIEYCTKVGRLYETSNAGTINVGANSLTLNNVPEYYSIRSNERKGSDFIVTGNAKATLNIVLGEDACIGAATGDKRYDLINKLANIGTVTMIDSNKCGHCLYIPNGVTGVTNLNLMDDTYVTLNNADLTVNNLKVATSGVKSPKDVVVSARNITIQTCAELMNCELRAGTAAVGTGKISIANFKSGDIANITSDKRKINLVGKQDKNGNSQIAISGTVDTSTIIAGGSEPDELIVVGLYYNNSNPQTGRGVYAQKYDGIKLLTGVRVPSDIVTLLLGVDGATKCMGVPSGTRSTYKVGKDIVYGLQTGEEAVLYGTDEQSRSVYESRFLTFEEALKEIDSLNQAKWMYEIHSLTSNTIDITNAKNQYVGLTLPAKASNLRIVSDAGDPVNLRFAGNITLRCPTEFCGVEFSPVKANGVATVYNLACGNYNCTLEKCKGIDTANSTIGNITGTAKSTLTLKCEDDKTYCANNITGFGSIDLAEGCNLKVNTNLTCTALCLTDGVGPAMLSCVGNITVGKLVSESSEGIYNCIERLTPTGKFTFNGVKVGTDYVINENDSYDIILPANAPLGTVVATSKYIGKLNINAVKFSGGEYQTRVSGNNLVTWKKND